MLIRCFSFFSLRIIFQDPFERLLAAQSILEDMPLISCDSILDSYGVTRYWDAP